MRERERERERKDSKRERVKLFVRDSKQIGRMIVCHNHRFLPIATLPNDEHR